MKTITECTITIVHDNQDYYVGADSFRSIEALRIALAVMDTEMFRCCQPDLSTEDDFEPHATDVVPDNNTGELYMDHVADVFFDIFEDNKTTITVMDLLSAYWLKK